MTQEQKIIAYKEYCKQQNLKESHAKSLDKFYTLLTDEVKQFFYELATDEITKRFYERIWKYDCYSKTSLHKKYLSKEQRLVELEKDLEQLKLQQKQLDDVEDAVMYKANEELIEQIEYMIEALELYLQTVIRYEMNDYEYDE